MKNRVPMLCRKFALGVSAAVGAASVQAGERSDFERYGDTMRYAVPLTAYAIAHAKGDDQGARHLLKGCAISLTLSEISKRVFNLTPFGARPHGGPNSFFSGHATGAMCGAAFLDARYGYSYGAPAYALAASVGASRMAADKHHFRDIAMASFVSMQVAHGLEDNGRETSSVLIASPGFQADRDREKMRIIRDFSDNAESADKSYAMNFAIFPDYRDKKRGWGVYLGISKSF